jgi:uncharacterized protein DUF1896
MRDILKKKLHEYLVANHPDLLVSLQGDGSVTNYLQDRMDILQDLPEVLAEKGQPAYIVEEVCMEMLTKDLRPSKFQFVCAVLSNSFESTYEIWVNNGILIYEVINLIEECNPLFKEFGFTEASEEDTNLMTAVVAKVERYISGQ